MQDGEAKPRARSERLRNLRRRARAICFKRCCIVLMSMGGTWEGPSAVPVPVGSLQTDMKVRWDARTEASRTTFVPCTLTCQSIHHTKRGDSYRGCPSDILVKFFGLFTLAFLENWHPLIALRCPCPFTLQKRKPR